MNRGLGPRSRGRSDLVVWIAIAAAIVIAASPLLSWTHAPITGGMRPASAWLTLPLGALAAGGLWRARPRVATVAAVLVVALCVTSLLYLAVVDVLFWRLVDENAQYGSAMEFAFRSTPGNFKTEPSFRRALATDTLVDRIAAGVYFMGRGWWAALVAGLVVLVAVHPRPWRLFGVSLAAALTVPAAVAVAGLVAEHHVSRARVELVRGRPEAAIARLDTAQRFAAVLRGSEAIHAMIGEARYAVGDAAGPHAEFFLSQFRKGDRSAAMARLRLAASTARAPLDEIVRRRLVWMHVEQGVLEYQRNRPGTAAGEWNRALAADPHHLLARYLIARAWFEQARYAESIAAAGAVLQRSRHPLLNAQVYLNVGDAYWKLGDTRRAREAYEAALKLDKDANYRGVRSLGGT